MTTAELVRACNPHNADWFMIDKPAKSRDPQIWALWLCRDVCPFREPCTREALQQKPRPTGQILAGEFWHDGETRPIPTAVLARYIKFRDDRKLRRI